jgi:curli production assembly/transport component CsgG
MWISKTIRSRQDTHKWTHTNGSYRSNEKAVASLVMEGIKDGIWESAAPKEEIDSVMLKYKKREWRSCNAIYGRKINRQKVKICNRIFWRSDFNGWDRKNRPMVRSFEIFLTPGFNLSASTNVMLANKGYSEKDMQHLILMLNILFKR